MHVNYEWKGPEEPLAGMSVTAVHMSIREINDEGEKLTAEGTFTFRDHMEGCDGKSPWVAVGTFNDNVFNWTVTRKTAGPGDFAFESKQGEPLFCLLDEVNTKIKAFVVAKLTDLARFMREHPEVVKKAKFVDELQRYNGPRHSHIGPCVCRKVEKSSPKSPFDWKKHTDGGKYPANCFQCSCGKQWYRGNKEE